MNIEQNKDFIAVEFEDNKLRYDANEWSSKQNYFTDGELLKLRKWKIDLIENYGVDIDDLPD